MYGGNGDDFFEIRRATVRIIEIGGQGIDTIRAYESFTLPSFVEVLDLDWAYQDVNGTGNAQDNTLRGNSAVNNLSGLAGDDSIYGNGGNDTLNGGDGDDTLVAGYYNLGSTTILGGNGSDILRGYEGGSDYMNGGAGDDVFYVDFESNDISDTIIEQMNGGYDEVICAADTYQLADNIEILTMVESADVAYGNAGNNFITGTDSGNQITADVMFNFRSFFHFIKLRYSVHAQLEIREVAEKMLRLVQESGQFKSTLEAFGLVDEAGELVKPFN
jgi:Ca2+-binding RTX toxin-like protein